MVQDNCRLRKGARQIGHVVELGLEQPGIETEAERGETGEALAEILVAVEPLRRAGAINLQARIIVPGGAVADALEAAARDRHVLFEDALGATADAEIDVADDAVDAFRLAVFAAGAHRRDAIDEFGLAQRLQLLRGVGAIHLAAFLKAGRDDIVAATDIVEQVLEQIAVARPVPHVMVRVDDRQIGLDDRFAALGEPVRADRRVAAGRDLRLRHGFSSRDCCSLGQLCLAAAPDATGLSRPRPIFVGGRFACPERERLMIEDR